MSTNAPSQGRARWNGLACLLAPLLLVAAGCLAYRNSLDGGFVLDDVHAIAENPGIHRWWPPAAALNPPPAEISFVTRPILNWTMAADYARHGLQPRGYHQTNLGLHLLAALALFLQLRQAFDSRSPGQGFWPAFAATLLWMVHPLTTAAVDYLTQRGEILSALFLSLMLYAVGRAASAVTRPARSGWQFLAVACCLLGMGSKESMAAAPLLAAAYDRIFFGASWRAVGRARGWMYAGLVLTWLWPLSRHLAYSPHLAAATIPWGTRWQYWLTQCWAIARMLRLVIWPRGLVFDYGQELLPGWAAGWPAALLVMILLAGSLALLVRRPRAGFAALAFWAWLAPAAALMPIMGQPVAEHRMYGPLSAVLALGVAAAWRGSARRTAWIVGLAVVLAAGGAWLTHQRNALYRDPLALWEDTLARRPGSARVLNNLGAELVKRQRHAEALPLLAEAIRRKPDYVDARYNLGTALNDLGRPQEARAQLEAVLRLQPRHAGAHNNLGKALVALRRPLDAIPAFRRALELDPAAREARNNLASALAMTGQYEEALAHFRAGLACAPNSPELNNNLAHTLLLLGRAEEARPLLEKALRLSPHYPDAWINLGQAALSAGQPEIALQSFQRALELRPRDAQVMNNIAWIRATDPDPSLRRGNDAVRLAEEARRLTGGQDPDMLDTLAAAYAETCRYDQATAIAREAADLMRAAGRTAALARVEARLERYRQQLPYRAPAPARAAP